MSLSELRTKLLIELQQIPGNKLGGTHDLVHPFQ